MSILYFILLCFKSVSQFVCVWLQQNFDRDVAAIVEMGFTAPQATSALQQSNGNLQLALNSLLPPPPSNDVNGRSNHNANNSGDRKDERGKGTAAGSKSETGAGSGGTQRDRNTGKISVTCLWLINRLF